MGFLQFIKDTIYYKKMCSEHALICTDYKEKCNHQEDLIRDLYRKVSLLENRIEERMNHAVKFIDNYISKIPPKKKLGRPRKNKDVKSP